MVYLELLDIFQCEKLAQDATAESFWSKFAVVRGFTSADPKLLDQGKQTKPMHMTEWFGPHNIFPCPRVRGWDGEGLVEMCNNGDVPGDTGQGACEETGCVMDEVGDDHFDYLRREPGDRTRACHGVFG